MAQGGLNDRGYFVMRSIASWVQEIVISNCNQIVQFHDTSVIFNTGINQLC